MTNLQDQRLELLQKLDAAKTRQERNKMGQFATPPRVADEIVAYALQQVGKREIRYLEPGFGTGAFYTSLLTQVGIDQEITEARGYEIDPYYAEPVRQLMASTPLDLRLQDFTEAKPEPFDIVLCNPPYVRHHHLESSKKIALSQQIGAQYGIKTTGLTGLYNYFMMQGEAWLSDVGISAWLVPSEFLDVNYGVAVKKFLLQNVVLTRIHLFESEDVQFDDALVSSAVVWYKKGKASPEHTIELSYGGSLLQPTHSRQVLHRTMDAQDKWMRQIKSGVNRSTSTRATREHFVLKDFFDVKRGLATGDNGFFILNEQQIEALQLPANVLTPVLPSPRYLKGEVVTSSAKGIPTNVDRLFLLNCRQTPDVLESNYPKVWKYLKSGVGTVSEKFLARNRKLWYLQESRDPAPILCTYMGRGPKDSNTPFRFILNESKAVATNSFLMLYPKPFWRMQAANDPHLMRRVWEILSSITTADMIAEGRTYGGGLEKIEPSELGNVPVRQLAELLNLMANPLLEAV